MSTRFLVRNNPGKYQGSSSARSAAALTEKQVASPYIIVSRPVRSTGWVNLRRAPSIEAKILIRCPQGKTLTVLAELDGWFKVEDIPTGLIGYISSKYVSRL